MEHLETPARLLKFRIKVPPERLAELYAQDFVGVGNYPSEGNPEFMRARDLTRALYSLALRHFGYPIGKPAEEFIERGFDVAVDYFCGDWWKDRDYTIEFMDKSLEGGDLQWIKSFSKGLFLGLLSGRWDDLGRVCAWIEADIQPEYTGGEFEDELVDLYRSLAAGLRPEPMPGLEAVEARILKSRKKRPKLLFQAWDAARSGNQAAFSDAFLKAIKHYESLYDPDSPNLCSPIDYIAVHHSIVALAARRKGMTLPELTPLQKAWLMSRESHGLPPK